MTSSKVQKLIAINGDYRFNYVIQGDRRQPVILFLHGFMGDCHDFNQVIDSLPNYCCVMVDLPGHGYTEVKQDANYRMSELAQALTVLLTKLNIRQCILLGYSLGGRIALYLAIHFPQYFYGVILESASPGLATQSERDRRIAKDLQLAQALESVDLVDFIQQWYQNPLFASFVAHPDYQQAIARKLNNNPDKLAKSLRYIGLGQQPNLHHRLSEIQIPLLLIVGELDLKFVNINQTMINSIPNANLTVIDNCGHNVHFEHSAKFSQLVKHFVRRWSPSVDSDQR